MRKDKMHHKETLEKSKGKHSRRLRDYAEKLARVTREEARPKQKTQTDSTTILAPGGCGTLVCGPDTACYPYNDNTEHLCVCTTTGEPPTDGQKCPRSKVHTVTENLLPGGCGPLVCRGETACIPHTGNTQHECLCTTTGEPPTEDMKCPRSTVSPAFRHRDKPAKVVQATTDSPDRLSSSEPYLGKFLPGGCGPLSCEKEMACMPYNNNTQHLCLCTTNGQPPNEDLKCPRSTVPLTPKPIHNIILPRTSNTSTDSKYSLSQFTGSNSQGSDEILAEAAAGSDSLATNNVQTSSAVWASIAIGGLLSAAILITIIVLLYLRKRVRRTDCKAQPRIRPGEPLLAERYITNPQYGVCGASALALSIPGSPGGPHGDEGPTVPLLHRNALTFLEEVGEGCFGKVHKGLLRSNDGESVVAIKVLKESANRSAEEDFEREVSIMSAFRHPNILALIGVVNRGDIGASPWMVFEYMEWGDLAGVLRGVRGGGRAGPILDDSALLHVALQVARGMQYLASRRFVHRDLAARNCLVGSQLAVKIADFGMSRDVYTCDYYKMGGERPMPVRWMSPESIIYARFTHESDVWSYGVVLWEIYSRGKQPFYGHNNNAVTKIILQGILLVPPENCPRFACELMRECWKSDPRDRIGFDDICLKLEAAHAAGDAVTQMRLPRPPPLPQDSAGYLVPAIGPPVDYVVPLPEPDLSDDGEEDYDYT